MEISSKVMSKWKNLIKTGDFKTNSKMEVKPIIDSLNQTKKTSTNILNKVSPISKNNSTNEKTSPETNQNTTANLSGSLFTTKIRPKTARAKVSKPRSTGNNLKKYIY